MKYTVCLKQISIKYSKTKCMIFYDSKSIENSISINGVNFQKVDGLKFLSVCIDHQIIWKDHITYI